MIKRLRDKLSGLREGLQTDDYDFDPAILRLQNQAPSPLPRFVLWSLLALIFCLLLWTVFGRLDVVVVAHGKLVPKSSLKIVQPAEAGIIEKILIAEGDEVQEGQVVAYMDTGFSDADGRILDNELQLKALQLRRIDAELSGEPLKRLEGDAGDLYDEVLKQYNARRNAYEDALKSATSMRIKLEQDLQGALEVKRKLKQTIPHFQQQNDSFQKMAQNGYVSKLMANDKQRELMEREQDLKAQSHNVESLRAALVQAEGQVAQVTSAYRQELQNERVQAEGEFLKLKEQAEKQSHRHELLALRSPQDGIVKDLTTHTPGTVVSPGSVLMTVVPNDEPVEVEVWVAHLDAGVVKPGLPVRVKLAAYPFQKYGMADGEIRQVSPDAFEVEETQKQGQQGYRAIVSLYKNYLERDGERFRLLPGMQASAELSFGTRTVMEYLLDPIQTTVHEAARER